MCTTGSLSQKQTSEKRNLGKAIESMFMNQKKGHEGNSPESAALTGHNLYQYPGSFLNKSPR